LAALEDNDVLLRRNALRLVSERENDSDAAKRKAVLANLNHSDPRVRLYALIALGSLHSSLETARAVVALWPDLKDKYLESAAVGVAAKDPLLLVEASFDAKDPALPAPFVSSVVTLLPYRQDTVHSA